MSDFDDVLERLLTDPGFKARLAADPASALDGYRLSAEELEVLGAQVGFDPGAQSRVEQRTSKASMFGLFSSLGADIGDVVGGHGPGHGLGGAVGVAGQHAEHVAEQAGGGRHPAAAFGAAPSPGDSEHGLGRHLGAVEDAQGGRHAVSGQGEVRAEAGPGGVYASAGGTTAYTSGGAAFASAQPDSANFGEAPPDSAGFGEAPPDSAGFGEAPPGSAGFGEAQPEAAPAGDHGPDGIAEAVNRGTVYRSGSYDSGLAGMIGNDVQPQAPTDGYHTRVDWDGDGKWDRHTYVERPDGGVDIVVDADGDGRPEFIGHDTDRDGLINSADVDTNRDGVMDARYEDLNGDGWLDRRTR
ncbi:hypothetical protein GCM10010399_29650 [Dactylosporangium fulvum]|uniref:Uncharacterized protein n=1 Tax=Dactylosporangium fulvum TaxID=53359 RepID=A0ABY5W3L4_9ACTN|nr:hypothetical protein [Dactylosporangium fulvum]UWP83824.1 hypothetical protein Dfulv_06070 [Dactylosporangium fulvum]